jgi:hypothetical protein
MVMGRLMLCVAALQALSGSVAAAPNGPAGTYTGTYECGHGPIALSLSFTPAPDGGLTALFYFYGLASNPQVPEGCFGMRGSYDPGSTAVVLYAGAWLLRPHNFVSVDLRGQLAGDLLTGVVAHPGCGSFSLRADRHPPPLPSACTGE